MTDRNLDPDLERLRDALRVGVGRDLARRAAARRRRVVASRSAGGGSVVLAGIAVGIFALTSSSSSQSGWVQQTLQRAAAVVAPPASADKILHITAVETMTLGARRLNLTPVAKLTEQAWIRGGQRARERAVLRVPGGPLLEEMASQGIYNKTDNLIYPWPKIPGGSPRYTLSPKGQARSYVLTARTPSGRLVTQKLDAHDAHALRAGRYVTSWAVWWDAKTQQQQLNVLVAPRSRTPPPTRDLTPSPGSTNFAAELRSLLTADDAHVTRTTTSDGKRAIEITQPEENTKHKTVFRRYYVTPKTYAPIELDIYAFGDPADETRIRIIDYQTIPLAGHQQLLEVHVPTSARIDHNPKGWWQATGLPRPF